MNDSLTWRCLHDGSLDQAEGLMPGDLVLVISIAYLRHAFEPAGEGFVLRLRNCSRFSLVRNDGGAHEDPREIAGFSPELLCVVSERPWVIATTLGTLVLAYDGLEIELDTGQTVSADSLHQACSSYWQKIALQRGGSA